MARVVMPEVWRAVGLIAEQPTTSELPSKGTFPDDRLDALILAARAVFNDEEPF